MPEAVTINQEELQRRYAAAFDKDEWLASLNRTLAGRGPLRQQRIDTLKAEIARFQLERNAELKEAHKHRNLARLAKGKINKIVSRIHQAQKTDKAEKAIRKKILRRKLTIKRLVAARLQIETAKKLRSTLKL